MRTIKCLLCVTLVTLLANSAMADKAPIRPDQRYLLVQTTKTSTMEKELASAAAQGFRILMGTYGLAVFMERLAEPPETYNYKLLATTKTSTMQKEMNDVAKEGFRLLPRAMMVSQTMLGNVEIVLILEKPPKVDKKYDYRLLATIQEGTMQKEVEQALADGYSLVGLVGRGEFVVIMEKELK